jgi:hypothetical protein
LFDILLLTDLHSVWDSLIITKQVRSTPRKYNRPIASKQVEKVLTGTIYDSYIRKIMWEGVLGDKWKSDVSSWPQCPSSTRVDAPEQQVLAQAKPKKGGDPDQWDTDTVCPYAWSAPIHQLNCDIVWPASTDGQPDDDLSHPHAHTVDEEMAMVDDDDDDNLHARPDDDDDLPDLDTPEYSGKIEDDWVIEELLAKGGVRLGAILNGLFAN